MASGKDYIRKSIVEDVHISGQDETIVDGNGNPADWLFDFRRVSLRPQFLDAVATEFFAAFPNEGNYQVGGMEVAAIPFVSAIVLNSLKQEHQINGFFIRKSRKKQGLLRMVEGEINTNEIILVDDIINSGSSFIRQIEVLEGLGKKVSAVFAILRFRDESYYTYLREKNIKIITLFSLDDLAPETNTRNVTPKEQTQVPMPFAIKWRFQSEKPNLFHVVPKSAPLLDNLHVYFGSDSGIFWALNRATGDPVWKYKVPFGANGKYIFSSPAIHNDMIYFGAYDGNFYALDRMSGKRKWVFMEADWIGSSPTVAGDLGLVFIGLEFGLVNKHGGVVALNTNTGMKKWEYSMEGLAHASPAYSRKFGLVVCGCNDGTFVALDAKTGSKKWEFAAEGAIRYGAAFHEALGLVFFGSEDGKLYAVRMTNGQLAFTFNIEFGMYSTPLVFNDHVYAAGLDKVLYCVDVHTGAELWRFRTNGRILASPELFLGKIYIGSNDGRLYELDPDSGKNTAIFQATERITNKIAGDEITGEIFVSTFANELYCLKK